MRKISCLFLLFLLSQTASGHLPGFPHQHNPFLPVADRSIYSLDEMAQKIRRETGGQILSAQEISNGGERYYRFKINKDGRIRVLQVRPDGSRVKHPR